jgi:hypothetical protein
MSPLEAVVTERLEHAADKPPEESSKKLVLDEFGRDAAERTVELESKDAESINNEVVDGRWQTYDQALHYVITRGLAEIKRQRDAAKAVAEKTLLKGIRDGWEKRLKDNPALITNPEIMKLMMAELGVIKK